ncbi:DMP19 family protein [Leisingera daeponensis]|uniref:DMP19 family protein n=1 Tax=Leisingera daeponensis TaxID=405746 RepID=A0ABS7NHD1_9RHOB|nr:DMP19 family protein [Leisingera daeponensis]MBY6140555.1 DMP19 family protein [Leisingera daeponensis]
MNWLKRLLAGDQLILPKPTIRETDFLSPETDIELRIEDYYDRLLGGFASEEIWAALDAYKLDSLRELVAKGLLTEGQMTFFCLEYFRAQILNGGFLQFMGNAAFMSADVVFCLRKLNQTEIADDVKRVASEIIPILRHLDSVPGDARNSEFRSAMRRANTEMKDAMLSSTAGQRLEAGTFEPGLVLQMVKYVERNPEEFCKAG